MRNYDYQKSLYEIWEKAVRKYNEGNREPDQYFEENELAFLRDELGQTAQEIYDYAEDFNNGGDPDFTTVAMVADIRRAFFKECQNGEGSSRQIDPDTLPPKDEAREGIEWLPRIIEKAKAKLHGELHPDIMYGCGGDRNFLKTNDIHSAEFLRVVWAYEGDDEQITRWVQKRHQESENAAASGERQPATGEGAAPVGG